ncbi:hypothetical protein E4U60_004941 [Claviceps pazoutovae]|uniref:Uncharacterized protein n=1 Tax=Claviceps pazoutovae TaxID=1649127 RepID=A0A9P7M862_9HYPO|nr:hypothetical protein E4U60_004941 [Claviceps pazoutovae]
MRLITALLPIFPTLVVANDHKSCACQSHKPGANNNVYDRDLTKWTCLNDFAGKADFDSGSGRCIAFNRQWLDGDRFENDCIWRGVVEGFYRYNPDGSVDKKSGLFFVSGASSKC